MLWLYNIINIQCELLVSYTVSIVFLLFFFFTLLYKKKKKKQVNFELYEVKEESGSCCCCLLRIPLLCFLVQHCLNAICKVLAFSVLFFFELLIRFGDS